ncbi:TetR/AcrR family transcriptional regulator [Geobacter sp. DSM 9736]|uniref:TetR/AcrR family transcriptional regulator n=1 Tax=Geobacter sp. DSM 9736 TaxID=1277350 RepID=UPI000B4FDBB0|nr:TetR/AcrR family transcriptional regulator [Geobacter sp. DSM 9736]SNB47111.1 transcriptional regulator, TetR family [Geobacter sp. DSM 9736]
MSESDKREAIINAALELVAECGFHGAPMAMVAERAGVGAGTIYRYFENKDTLITETYAAFEQRLVAAVMEGYPERKGVRDRYIHLATILIKYFIASPMEFRFAEQFHNSPYGAAHRREKVFGKQEKDICTEIFEDGKGQGIVKDLPLVMLFALTFGPLVDMCRDHILGFIDLNEELSLKAAEACWDAVRQ